jgi:hypothetical protein
VMVNEALAKMDALFCRMYEAGCQQLDGLEFADATSSEVRKQILFQVCPRTRSAQFPNEKGRPVDETGRPWTFCWSV